MQSHSLLDTKCGLIPQKNGTNNSKCNVCSTVILQKGVNTSNMLKHLSGWTTTDHLSVRVWCSKTKLFCWHWKAIRPTFFHTENPLKSIRQSLSINENHDSHPWFGHKSTLVFREGRSKVIHWDNLGIKHSYLVRKVFFLTAYPFGVIEDILDCQWCEHHTNCLSWHTHLCTVWEKP